MSCLDEDVAIVAPSVDTPTRSCALRPRSSRQRTIQSADAIHLACSSSASTVFATLRRLMSPLPLSNPVGRWRSGSTPAHREL